jgi:hypothetical protein
MKLSPWLKVLALILGFAATLAAAAPLKIGFAQTGAESAWRTANSESMKAEAAKRGIDLKFSDAQGKQENQIRAAALVHHAGRRRHRDRADRRDRLGPVLRDAKRAGIPVMLTDRTIQTTDESLFACFIGSDFLRGRPHGRRLAGEEDRRQGQHRRVAGHARLRASQRPPQGLRRRHHQVPRPENHRLAER